MSHTYDEIHNQPHSWEQTIVAAAEQWRTIAATLEIKPDTHFVCVGSGTSLYLAQSAAQSLHEITRHVAVAVPSSEIFLSSVSSVPEHVPVIAFVISRSGTTSEALLAIDHLSTQCANVQVVGVTCHRNTALASKAHWAIELPHAAEQSVVMTQSFTNMLLALQIVACAIAGNHAMLEELRRLPALLREHLATFESAACHVAENLALQRFVYLGLGPNYGLAQEATLKLKEMTQTPCEAYNPLEFRHGPISIVTEGTAVVLLEGQRERAYTGQVEQDVQRYGAHVVAIGPYSAARADQWISLPEGLSDLARCVLYLPPVQLIAYHRALALRLNPDQPRNLDQVVVIDHA